MKAVVPWGRAGSALVIYPTPFPNPLEQQQFLVEHPSGEKPSTPRTASDSGTLRSTYGRKKMRKPKILLGISEILEGPLDVLECVRGGR